MPAESSEQLDRRNTRRSRRRGRAGFGALAAALASGAPALLLIALAGSAWAQPGSGGGPGPDATAPPPTRPQAPAQSADFTGRDFAGLKLAIPELSGPLSFEASRADFWVEEPLLTAEGQTLGAPVRRLHLRGDVRVRVGVYSFAAARAVAWIEELGPGPANADGTPSDARQYQVAVFFDRLNDPTAQSGTTQAGDRVLVTAAIAGAFSLKTDLLVRGRPAADPLVLESEQRLRRLLLASSGLDEPAPKPAPPTGARGGRTRPDPLSRIRPGESQPFEPTGRGRSFVRGGERVFLPDGGLPAANEGDGGADGMGAGGFEGTGERLPPIFAGRGVVTFASGEIAFVPGADEQRDENQIIITGGATVVYVDRRTGRELQLTAERAVVFLMPGRVDQLARTATADAVRGIYLEGDVVATDGRYTLRGAQVFYDVQANRALMIDAVFWTYDQRRGMPMYVRAKAIRQTAANQIQAENVRISNSSFFEPHVSLGASSVTVTREAVAVEGGGAGDVAGSGSGVGGGERIVVDGQGVTLRAGDLPFFYVPRYRGEVERFALKDVRFENSSGSGFAVKTTFDLFGLAGVDSPAGLRADLRVDGFVRRGIGLGLDGRYRALAAESNFLAYILPNDEGRDTLSSGIQRSRDGDVRGILLVDHRFLIDDQWSAWLEGSYISDPNFVDAFYEPLAKIRREFATAAELRRREGNTNLTIVAKGNLNEFTPNEFLIQSQGYTVAKLPEVVYYRLNDDLLRAVEPGLLTWTSEYRAGRVQFEPIDRTISRLGFESGTTARDAFGRFQPSGGPPVAPGDKISDLLAAGGLTDRATTRLDTRQQLDAKLSFGPLLVSPFATGRVTFYDRKFEALTPGEADQTRFWGAIGASVSTSVQRIDDSVESRLLDLHRIRHIVEPSVTGWWADTNRDRTELPQYDDGVENLNQGGVVRAGVLNTWQTQRGGPGRWRVVDVLKLNTEVVYAEEAPLPPKAGDPFGGAINAPISPIGRWYSTRPESATFGRYTNVEGVWQATDAAALTFSNVYDLEQNRVAMTTAGGLLNHSADLTSFAEVRQINIRDSLFVTTGAEYRLSDKYTLGGAITYDAQANNFQEFAFRLSREFPALVGQLNFRYNNITDEFSVGVTVRPNLGEDPRSAQLRRLGRDQVDAGDIPGDGGITRVPGDDRAQRAAGAGFGAGPLGAGGTRP